MAKKVAVRLETREISSGGKYKPNSPIWSFVNTGTSVLVINQNYKLLPGATFGLDLSALVASLIEKGIVIENETTFSVEFTNSAGVKDFDVRGASIGLGHLLEVIIELK